MPPLFPFIYLLVLVFGSTWAYATVGESGTLSLDTRDDFSGLMAESSTFALDARSIDGLSGADVTDAFVLDTRSSLGNGPLAIVGPPIVITGTETPYRVMLDLGNGQSADVSNQCLLRFAHPNPPGIGIGGLTVFVSKDAQSMPLQLIANYRNAAGQTTSAIFSVFVQSGFHASIKAQRPIIDGNTQSVALSASSTGEPPLIYRWHVVGGTASDDNEGENHTLVSDLKGKTVEVRLEVEDALGSKAYTFRKVVLPNAPVAGQPADQPLATDPEPSEYYSADLCSFVPDENRKKNGILIITHGLRSSAKAGWPKIMAQNVIGQLRDDSPNIMIFDWSKEADPQLNAESREKVKKSFPFLPDSAGSDPVSEFLIDCLSIRLADGPRAGRRLSNWILQHIANGDIDEGKPIHLIGHSAGGFCMGQCAWEMEENHDLPVDMVTMLDTPFPDVLHVSNLRYPGWLERYVSTVYASEASDMPRFPPDNHYRIEKQYSSLAGRYSFGVTGHEWVHNWYTNTIFNGSSTGWPLSPIVNSNNRLNRNAPGDSASFARNSNWNDDSLQTDTVADQPLTDFSTFGNAALAGAQYVLTEQADTGLTQELSIPIGAITLKFRYRFIGAGDGDFLNVSFADIPPIYVGEDLAFARQDFVEAEIPVGWLAGTIGRLTFTLVSRGSPNAILQIEDIAFGMSDDPDADGLPTDQEATAGTDPLAFDTDSDSLDDLSELTATPPTSPLLPDSDFDGTDDSQELLAGTNPVDTHSRFQVVQAQRTGNSFLLRWSGVAGKTYQVHRSDEPGFGSFTTVASGVTGVVPLTTYLDTALGAPAPSRLFYRVQVEE